MHFYETRLYKLWYFESNACAVMSWEPRMLQGSRGVVCVRPCKHAARKWVQCLSLEYTPLYDCSSLLEELRA